MVGSLSIERSTPLHLCRTWAARVLWCLGHADLEARKEFDYTPLLRAVCTSNYPVVQQLLRLGADVCAQENGGCSVVLAAALREHHKMAFPALPVILLEAGADINVPDCKGYTVMENACRWMDSSFLALVLEWGADPTVTSSRWNMADVVKRRRGMDRAEKAAMLLALSAVGVQPSNDEDA